MAHRPQLLGDWLDPVLEREAKELIGPQLTPPAEGQALSNRMPDARAEE